MLPFSSKLNEIFLIEDDIMVEQNKRKAKRTCGQRDMAEILLELRKQSSNESFISRPTLSSSLYPIDKKRRVLYDLHENRNYIPVSDDEEDENLVLSNKSISNKKQSEGERQSDFFISSMKPLPVGRPLPPAPRFPRCLPGTTITL
jgi:hypothetical protein